VTKVTVLLLLTFLLSVIVYVVTNIIVFQLLFLFMLEFGVMALSYFVTIFFCDLPFRAFFFVYLVVRRK